VKVKKSLSTPLVPIEDLFVTGILATKCGFPIQNIPGFYVRRVNPCNSTLEILLAHNIYPDEQKPFETILARQSSDNCTWNVNRKL
jgi:hypothetical protein